jgi:DNA modification methylase
MKPYYEQDGITIYHGDCREVLSDLSHCELLLTDPPYPNSAGHFDAAVAVAREVLPKITTPRGYVFWHQLERPPMSRPFVAHHVWHRTNSNRPNNYEAIYEFAEDGAPRANRVFPYPVIYPGLTGCIEATGHPTQKPVRLFEKLILLAKAASVCDPFMGSGTTLAAAQRLERRAIGVEINERYCEIAAERLSQSVANRNADVQAAPSLTSATPDGQTEGLFA